jgi:hypothetical protein
VTKRYLYPFTLLHEYSKFISTPTWTRHFIGAWGETTIELGREIRDTHLVIVYHAGITGLGFDDGHMGHHYECSGDQADALMLDVIDGSGGIPLLFFRSNGSPGNMPHSRITSYPLYKHNNTAPPTTESSIVPFSIESDAVSAGMAWRILVLPLPIIHHSSP